MKKHYVYELINLYGTIEDVGVSYRPEHRLYQHIKCKPTLSGMGKYYGRQDLIMHIVDEFDNRKDAFKLEGQLKLLYNLSWTEKERDMNNGKRNKENGHWDRIKHLGNEKKSTPVIVYKKDGTFIGEYSSQRECARQLNINDKHISAVCKGNRKSTSGYIITYKNQPTL